TPTVNASTPGYRFPIGSAHLSDCLRNIGCMHGFLPATAPYSRSPIARRLAAARDIGICGPGTCSERRRAGVGRADGDSGRSLEHDGSWSGWPSVVVRERYPLHLSTSPHRSWLPLWVERLDTGHYRFPGMPKTGG